MPLSKAFALAFILAAQGLISPSSAQNAPQCPMSGSPSDWGFNSTGYIMIASGGSCLFSINISGEIFRSSISKTSTRDLA
jgi:hypothetical protein